jgi:hypothetical protein
MAVSSGSARTYLVASGLVLLAVVSSVLSRRSSDVGGRAIVTVPT